MDWKQVLSPLCRSRIETRFAPAGETLPAGSSKFGGRPDVPAGFVWPVFETKTFDDDTVKPRPLAFLAQFDCARWPAGPGGAAAQDRPALLFL